MRRHPRVLLALLVLTGVAGLVSAVVGGSGGYRHAAPSGSIAAATARPVVAWSDPQAVCDAFAAALLARHGASGSDAVDEYARAAGYADPALADAMRAPAPRQAPAAHLGRVEVSVEPFVGEPPPDHAGVAYRAVVVVAVASGVDGRRAPPGRHTVYCTLRGDGARWLVVGNDLDPPAGP